MRDSTIVNACNHVLSLCWHSPRDSPSSWTAVLLLTAVCWSGAGQPGWQQAHGIAAGVPQGVLGWCAAMQWLSYVFFCVAGLSWSQVLPAPQQKSCRAMQDPAPLQQAGAAPGPSRVFPASG